LELSIFFITKSQQEIGKEMRSLKMKSYRWLLGSLAGLFLMALTTSVFSSELMVTRAFTGVWDQVSQESQGLDLQVIAQADGSNVAVAYWYTYGNDRKSAWYLGVGHIVDDHVDFELYHSDDVGFMQNGMPGDDSVVPIGTMTMSFHDCNSGTVTFNTSHAEVGQGSFEIGRLSNIMNMHCSGGISDNMDGMSMYGERRIDLLSARNDITGNGHARFEAYSGRAAFEVNTEGLPDGSYHLYVGDEDRGTFDVVGGMGDLEFASPAETNKPLLTFDPRGLQIRIHDEAGAVLSSFEGTFEEGYHGHDGDYDHMYDCDNYMGGMGGMGGWGGMGGHGMGGMGGYGMDYCVEDGDAIEIDVDMTSTGQINGARGEAEWEMTTNHTRFSVEIDNVPAGSYPLMVGGNEVGIIEAYEMMHSGVYGRIMFRDPQTYGGYHLDFDPRGQTIEVIQQGGGVILTVDFPEE